MACSLRALFDDAVMCCAGAIFYLELRAGMVPKLLATKWATGSSVGLALLLAWAMPPAMFAQLPDAPSAVWTRQQAGTGLAAVHRLDILAGTDDSGSAAGGQFRLIAWNMGSAPEGQESIYRAPKQNAAPGFSSSVAALRPVPGSAPSLHTACPRDSCPIAQELMCCGTAPSPFAQYLKYPDVVPLTARDNLRSAFKNIIDPFNLGTIVVDSAIGVASDSHSVYGPGARGFAKYAGVSMTEDLTGEFFGTFLVPSLTYQDPHYHREPFVSIKRRMLHAVTQVFWTQSYTGRPMLNYANIVGGIATAVVSNTFVPGPGRQGFSSTSQRLAIAFATSPSGNLIEEFVPDLASRINLRVVIFQRILNSVAIEEGGVQ